MLKARTIKLPDEIALVTTKQKIYQFIKDNPDCLTNQITKAVGIIDVGVHVNTLERLGLIISKKQECCNAKRWRVK